VGTGLSTELMVGLVRVAERCPGMLDHLCRDLASGHPASEPEILRKAGSYWHRSDILAALFTLSQAGALVASRSGLSTTYAATSDLSAMVDRATSTAALLPDLRRQFDRENHAALVVSWPSSLRDLEFRRWRSSRLVLVEMIDSAESSAVLLFPFVDLEGVEDVSRAIERALLREVQVTLLTRYLTNANSANARLVDRFARAKNGERLFEAGAISSGDPSRELLHAKVLVVDEGRRAYVGSANLTLGGLGDSIEIGLALDGEAAASVAALVREVLGARGPAT
jgi:phosphatidylserine/phosphatidylglycerophosphate/cardiolipin synthase-like enzyme